MATLALRNVIKAFGSNRALNDVSLELRTGELVSLLGPSGCGKTTALRAVAGFERPDSGQVLVDGKDITAMAANKRDMGMVFQAYSLFPNMTAAQNIEFGMRMRKKSSAARAKRADELLTLVGLEGRGKSYAHQMSGGQQQRVALARALAIEPSVLLLDEPLSALDAKVRVQLREEIRRLQLEVGITALFVTHDQEEALSISDRVGVMNRGRVEQIDVPEVLYRAPATEFVAGFVGTINRLPVTSGGGSAVQYGSATLAVAAANIGAAPGPQVLLVRPELLHVSMVASGGSAPSGSIPGTVSLAGFLGPVRRLNVATDLGHTLICDVAGRAGDGLVPGTSVSVSFAPDVATVVPAAV